MFNKKVIAIIPARGGSKGIPHKNIINLAGKPLIFYTIEAAKKSKIFDKIVVSTDDKMIAKVAKKYGAQVIIRPKFLAKDNTPTEPVIEHTLKHLERHENYIPNIIFLLQPTSPLRDEFDIKKAYKEFLKQKVDSLLSVTRNANFIWINDKNKFRPINYNYLKRPRRQEIKNQFKENGAIYITRYQIFIKYKNRLGGKIGYYLMDEESSVEIDNPIDLAIAEQIFKKRNLISRRRI